MIEIKKKKRKKNLKRPRKKKLRKEETRRGSELKVRLGQVGKRFLLRKPRVREKS